MKIVILGAGAMGSLFGAKLVKGGIEDVWLIDIWEEHVRKIQKDGLLLETKDGKEIVKINAVLSPDEAYADIGGKVDLIIVFVKGTATETAVSNAEIIIGENTKIITVQNGLGNAEKIAKYVNPKNIYYGTTSVGSNILEAGSVKHTSENRVSATYLMPYKGDITSDLKAIAEMFTSCGLDTVASGETEALIWEKLTINCVGNCLSVLLRLTMKTIMDDSKGNGEKLVDLIIDEICKVAKAKGLDFNRERIDWIIPRMRKTENYSSMGFDAKNKKPTEIDAINGAIIREGKKLGIPTPVNETLYYLVKLIENNYDELWY